jgi:ABC-type multidrug transport system fused ATPase/permease subunit
MRCSVSLHVLRNALTGHLVQVEWRDITYTVEVGKGAARKKKQILNGLSGIVEPGHVVAIMGPTGSGKTRFVVCQPTLVPLPSSVPLL